MGIQNFRGADAPVSVLGELERIWLFDSEVMLVGCLLEQRGCPLEWDADKRSISARNHQPACL